jgi:hypothetical protein
MSLFLIILSSFSLSSYALFPTFISESHCATLQCFYKGCMQQKQQLAVSWLMHSTHSGRDIFPYQLPESGSVQDI